MKIFTEKQFKAAVDKELEARRYKQFIEHRIDKIDDKVWELEEDVGILKNEIKLLKKDAD